MAHHIFVAAVERVSTFVVEETQAARDVVVAVGEAWTCWVDDDPSLELDRTDLDMPAVEVGLPSAVEVALPFAIEDIPDLTVGQVYWHPTLGLPMPPCRLNQEYQ